MGTVIAQDPRRFVWIVCHDESPDNTVLGVFSTAAEAEAYAVEVEHRFENGVIYSAFPIGYRRFNSEVTYTAPGGAREE